MLLGDLSDPGDSQPAEGIVRDPLAAQVRRFVNRRLCSGIWKPGHRVTIRSLAQELGISTTPVREVLLQLVSTGCLELRQNASFTVPRMSLAAYLETRRLRVLLEGEAALVAAMQATSKEINGLAEIQARYIAAEASGDVPAALEWNRAFHLTLSELSRLPTLITFVEALWLRSGPLMNALYPRMQPWQQETSRHDRVVTALRERNGEAAKSAIQEDIVVGGRQLEETLRAQEEAEPGPKLS